MVFAAMPLALRSSPHLCTVSGATRFRSLWPSLNLMITAFQRFASRGRTPLANRTLVPSVCKASQRFATSDIGLNLVCRGEAADVTIR